MIAVSFILRILKFLLAFVVIAGGAAVLWFCMLYMVKKSIDVIEESNRDFFIWLREKWPFNKVIERRIRNNNSSRLNLHSSGADRIEINTMASALKDGQITQERFDLWLDEFIGSLYSGQNKE